MFIKVLALEVLSALFAAYVAAVEYVPVYSVDQKPIRTWKQEN